jgi:mono/diheme cytochrome c family protein
MSVPLIVGRMKSRGVDISISDANQLATEARSALLKRLYEGGEKMPSFSYLTEGEIASIVAYLNQLAEVPGPAKELKAIRESPERVGELIVKSTCHICHGATGPNPTEQQLFQGEIPSLEALTSRVDQVKFVRKVIHGAPILMGEPPMLYRGRMPVFYYLNPQEVADAYLYLSYYPPVNKARSIPVASSIQSPETPPAGGGSSQTDRGPTDSITETRLDSGFTARTVVVIAGLSVLVLTLVAGGLAFTVRELARMSAQGEQPHHPEATSASREQEETHLVTT